MRVVWLSSIGLAVMLGTSAVAQSAVAQSAVAQSVVPVPAELPPADFAGREYVDSLGCAFQRAGVSGTRVWVPRLGGDRTPVCGKSPSLAVTTLTPQTEPDAAGLPTDAGAAASPVKPAAARTKKPAAAAPRADLALVESGDVATAATRCPSRAGKAQQFLISDGRRITKCGDAVADEVGFINALQVPNLRVTGIDRSQKAVAAAKTAADNGYRLVWTNVPLRPAEKQAVSPATPTMKWLQVGAFSQAVNADRAVVDLKKLGLPVARTTLTVGGRRLTAILAGPFATPADLAAALDRVRRAGFQEAFPRG